jgi:hypothetical protein
MDILLCFVNIVAAIIVEMGRDFREGAGQLALFGVASVIVEMNDDVSAGHAARGYPAFGIAAVTVDVEVAA